MVNVQKLLERVRALFQSLVDEYEDILTTTTNPDQRARIEKEIVQLRDVIALLDKE